MLVTTQLLRRCGELSLRAMSSAEAERVQEYAINGSQAKYLSELCIAVDRNDRPIRSVSKRDCHSVQTMVLHRAFSVFLFTSSGSLVLQKRSASKVTFPSVWTNSCCSHPLWNEYEMPVNGSILGVCRAAQRKLRHELGIHKLPIENMNVMGRYIYKSMSDTGWGEHELDYVIVVPDFNAAELRPNSEEVEETAIVDREQLKAMVAGGAKFSPWFTLLMNGLYLNTWWDNLDRLAHFKDLDTIRVLN
ncbi:Isopentenyl-diphosphate Delta-isomerase I, chloroplastic [Toxocara canis]|uniref:isopentenyl-diphosphate Delta-isomerase n=1 Tax=Toxocara canis TaxID=6265 RepID=A0A0B2V9L6_TOXCA|nr:Isopentenyl-diphosphate Delta-isomerase I, chloroplastic [Toxocara canis]